MSVSATPVPMAAAQPWRAWLVLIGFSLRRQAFGWMVWIALGLLLLAAVVVLVIDQTTGWEMYSRRPPRSFWSHSTWLHLLEIQRAALGSNSTASGIEAAVIGAYQAVLQTSAFAVFSRWVVFAVFLGFLMPMFTLSFAISALGSDRESRSLIWLVTRPLPRSSIYLAKFLGVLPWCLALNLGGLLLLCSLAGSPGWRAFALYWPAVVGGTLAFAALFHLMGAMFRRPAVVALVYAFFVETLVGDLPGTLKRVSISYYTRCLMFNAADTEGFTPEKATLFQPVGDTTAWSVLLGLTLLLTLLGMAWFARSEYHEDT